MLSVPATYLGVSATHRSNALGMKRFLTALLLLAVLPVLAGMAVHFGELWTWATDKKAEGIELWRVSYVLRTTITHLAIDVIEPVALETCVANDKAQFHFPLEGETSPLEREDIHKYHFLNRVFLET